MGRLTAALLLFGAPAWAADPAEAPGLAELYGYTLGAAQACPSLSAGRVGAAAARAAQHLKDVAGSDTGADAAASALQVGIAEGRRDIATGLITCTQAESELANLEHELSP